MRRQLKQLMAFLHRRKDDDSMSKIVLPLLPLRDIIVFPHMVAPLFVGRAKSVSALTEAMSREKSVFLSAQKTAELDSPGPGDIHEIGTIGNVLQMLHLPDGTVKALVEGKARAKISRWLATDSFFQVEAVPLVDQVGMDGAEIHALRRAVLDAFGRYAKINRNISKELFTSIRGISDPSRFSDTIASHFAFEIGRKQELLESLVVPRRLSTLLKLIRMEIEVFQVDQRIKGRVKEQMERTQKNYYLSEKMRAIKKEMGAEDDATEELDDLERKIRRRRMPREARKKVWQEFKKLRMMTPMSAEATVVRNYIDWIISLPWFDRTRVNTDIDEAERILDSEHYGLEKPKERILEYLAVQTLMEKIKGPILCLVGPPGVGKTSVARSVANATGRKFVRLSLGGVRDEAEIRGHRRTYIGAMPGKIIQSLKKVGARNPVFCLDEVDKMSTDFRGDPSSALLEVLDPEQNYGFNDHYLDLDFDLTDILFITTANTLHGIPLPLQDRMEIIRLPGYTEIEKRRIARDYLIPKQTGANGLSGVDISFTPNAEMEIIRHHTREAGVRNLERQVAAICRKIARDIVRDKNGGKAAAGSREAKGRYRITEKSVGKYLGPPKFRHGSVEKKDQVGMVTGLAWTQVGGELLSVETLIMPGKGRLTVTGKLGDVMKESCQAAVSYTRSRSKTLKLDPEFYGKYDIHIHVPEGAIPKDGPSAGIAISTSLSSALTRRAVHRDIAMTGEITLRGRVLPIGGLKEKVLAAHRGGITRVLIPKENEKDLKDIPASVSRQVEIIPVEHMDEVLFHALLTEPDGDEPDLSLKADELPADDLPSGVSIDLVPKKEREEKQPAIN